MIESANSSSNPGTKCYSPRGWLRVECAHGAIYWKPLRCRACEGCYAAKTRAITARVLFGMDGAAYASLMTLTTRPGTSWPDIMKAWTSLIKWVRKHYGGAEYAVVKEEGSRNGMRHLHAVITGPAFIPHAALSAAWRERVGAFVVDIRRIRAGGVAGYVAKYVAKGRERWAKCVTYSRAWPRDVLPEALAIQRVSGRPVERPWLVATESDTLVESWGWDGPCKCVHVPDVEPGRMGVVSETGGKYADYYGSV